MRQQILPRLQRGKPSTPDSRRKTPGYLLPAASRRKVSKMLRDFLNLALPFHHHQKIFWQLSKSFRGFKH
jgi:hypothetical protein